MDLHIGFGNAKIDKSVGIFDLPVVTTCPGSGACISYCYAMKTEWMGEGYPTAMHRYENLKKTYEPTFVDEMVHKIRQNKFRLFRPHESGDFYDSAYVKKWAEIAKRCPQTTFYAYTKSLNPEINLTPLTSIPTHNFTLIYSEGGKFNSKINKSTDNYAAILPISRINKTVRKGEYLCPEVRASGKKTEKFCAYNCNYCLSSRDTGLTKKHQIRVVFPLRRGGWSGKILFPRPPGSLIRPLPGAPRTQKPTQPATLPPWPKKVKGGDPKAYRMALANAVEARFAYMHLLLAGYTDASILQLTGLRNFSELRREHALELIQRKAVMDEMGRGKIIFKGPLSRKRTRGKAKST